MTDAQAEFDALAGELEQLGAKRSKMFGMPCLKNPGGKAFVGLSGDELVVKLGRDTPQHAEALKIEGAHLFDPMGGRPMKEWICLPVAARSSWAGFAIAARSTPR